jgi:hypothetical protein
MSEAEAGDEEFAAPLGRLLLAVADAEGVAGELVVLKIRSSGPASSAWSRSGEQLFKELRRCYDREDFVRLCDDFEALNAQRNQLFHGEWRFIEPNKAFVLKRSHMKEAKRASYQGAWVTPQQVTRMTELYRKVQKGLDGYISEAMAQPAS